MSLTREEVRNEIMEAIKLNSEAKRKVNDALCHANNLVRASERGDDYNRGLEDAWEFARRLYLNADEGGISTEVMRKLYDTACYGSVILDFSVHEAMEKLKEYEKEVEEEVSRIKIGEGVKVINSTNPDYGRVGIYVGETLMSYFVVVKGVQWPLAYDKSYYELEKISYDGPGVRVVGIDIQRVLEELERTCC